MGIPTRRCAFIGGDGTQCEKWFEARDNNKICAFHRGEKPKEDEQVKIAYIELVNVQRKYCYTLDFEALDSHIQELEKVLENARVSAMTARQVKAEKLDTLTEEQRKELRKIKVSREVVKEVKAKKPSLKKDPIKYLMETYKITEEQAKKMMDMD
jgi:hypothetical protein